MEPHIYRQSELTVTHFLILIIFEQMNKPSLLQRHASIWFTEITIIQSQSNISGTTTDLLCKLEGYPFPSVTWYKDNKPLPASNRLLTNHNMNSGLVSLRLGDTRPGDTGYYTAVAENKAGQDQTFCTVQVNETHGVDSTPMVNPEAFRYLENGPADRNRRPEPEQLIPPKVN